jgi:hypothetical protein
MSPRFGTIESAHEYVGLLLEAIHETASELDEWRQTSHTASPDRCELLRLIAYKLEQLRFHIDASHHRLSDLRTLDRMLEEGHHVAAAC